MSILSQNNYKTKTKYGGEFGRRGSEFREDKNPEETAIRSSEAGVKNLGNKKLTPSERAKSLAELAVRTKATLESLEKTNPQPGAEEVSEYRNHFINALD